MLTLVVCFSGVFIAAMIFAYAMGNAKKLSKAKECVK